MAKAKGGIVGLVSGTIDGFTYQTWRGIQTIRETPTPHNPKTERQMEVRIINTELSRRWRDVLNQGQRTAWNQRATNFSWTTILGKEIAKTGQNLYIKQNFPLLDYGLPPQDTPPPMVMPPELFDVVDVGGANSVQIIVPQLVDGIITAQIPFLDIWIAGGWITASLTDNAVWEAETETQAISQGRVHQNSDFKHVLYAPDKPIILPPAAESLFTVYIPLLSTKNVVVIMRRYNQYGNYSQAKVFQKIISTV